jgi:hypothetical protein
MSESSAAAPSPLYLTWDWDRSLTVAKSSRTRFYSAAERTPAQAQADRATPACRGHCRIHPDRAACTDANKSQLRRLLLRVTPRRGLKQDRQPAGGSCGVVRARLRYDGRVFGRVTCPCPCPGVVEPTRHSNGLRSEAPVRQLAWLSRSGSRDKKKKKNFAMQRDILSFRVSRRWNHAASLAPIWSSVRLSHIQRWYTPDTYSTEYRSGCSGSELDIQRQ